MDAKSSNFVLVYFQTEFGFKIPDWAQTAYSTITDLAVLDYKTSTATTIQKRLSSGNFFYFTNKPRLAKKMNILKRYLFLFAKYFFFSTNLFSKKEYNTVF